MYTDCIKQCKESVKEHYTVDGLLTPPPLNSCIPPNSVDIEAHYSFDFAQQVCTLIKSTTDIVALFEEYALNNKELMYCVHYLPNGFFHRCTTPRTHSSQVPYFFSLRESAVCLVCIARHSPDKSISSLMKLGTVAKEQIL